MSHKATDWAWQQSVRGVRQHVLLALADRANVKTRQCSPSMAELIERTGLSENTIRTHLKGLAEDGLIVAEVSNGGRRKRSTYTLLIGNARSKTPQELRGFEGAHTPQEVGGYETETPQELRKNPSGDAPVVLRTKTRTREPGSTCAAAASPDTDPGLFPAAVVPPRPKTAELAVSAPNAGTAVAAWVDGYTAHHDAKPTSRQIGQVGREARQLLEAGNPPERVVAAAASAGQRGFCTLERQYRELATRRNAPVPVGIATRPSTTDTRTAAALALAEKYDRQEATG